MVEEWVCFAPLVPLETPSTSSKCCRLSAWLLFLAWSLRAYGYPHWPLHLTCFSGICGRSDVVDYVKGEGSGCAKLERPHCRVPILVALHSV